MKNILNWYANGYTIDSVINTKQYTLQYKVYGEALNGCAVKNHINQF